MFHIDLSVVGAPAELACFETVLEQCISLDGRIGLEEWLEQASRCGPRLASMAYTARISSRHVNSVARAESWLKHASKDGITVNPQFLVQSCVPVLGQERTMLHESAFKRCSNIQRIVPPPTCRCSALTQQPLTSSRTHLPSGGEQ